MNTSQSSSSGRPAAWVRFKAASGSPHREDPYLSQTFPIELDEAITRLVEAFRQVDIGNRSGWAKDLPMEVGDSQFLLTYAVRMATQALRKASPDRIKDGLAAVLLEGERDDWRESVIVLSLLNDAAKKIGTDPLQLFEDAARMAPNLPSSETIREFPRRKPEDLAIEAMGYRISTTSDGFQYEPNPAAWRR